MKKPNCRRGPIELAAAQFQQNPTLIMFQVSTHERQGDLQVKV
jgi:hypothetical protein